MLTYEAALKYIYRFTDYEQKSAYRYAPENFDLARIEHLLTLLGSPHKKLRFVHVAGTKGKGSISSMISSIAETAGYRVGLFTSPHLHTFRERIRINSRLISPGEVAELVEEIQPHADRVTGITTFEVVTTLALLYFHRRRVDLAVLEVGLGGRLDATNVVLPEVSVISSLSYDHVQQLGNTLTEIAREKAGIIKPGIPTVSSPQAAEALAVIAEVCREKRAELTLIGRDWTWERGHFNHEGQRFTVCHVATNPVETCRELWIPLLGQHQLVNAATAIAAVMELRKKAYEIPDSAIESGLRRLYWPGRLELLSQSPVIVADSAHNADSAQKLIQALREHFPGRPIVLIFGASGDKDIEGMLREFIPNVRTILFTQSDHPRAIDPRLLHDKAVALGGNGEVLENMEAALERALQIAGPDELICGTGSVFIVANLRETWAKRAGKTLPEWD